VGAGKAAAVRSPQKYNLHAQDAPATIYIEYAPAASETTVIAGLEEMVAPGNQARFAQIARNLTEHGLGNIPEGERKPIMIWMHNTMHADGDSYNSEREILERASGGVVTMNRYTSLEHLTRVTGVKNLNPDYTHVFTMYDSDLRELKNRELEKQDEKERGEASEHEPENILMQRILPIERPEGVEGRGIAFVREAEEAAAILGNTDREDITNAQGNALSLQRVMRGLLSEEIELAGLIHLMGQGRTEGVLGRLNALLGDLLVTRAAEDVDEDLDTRRKLLKYL